MRTLHLFLNHLPMYGMLGGLVIGLVFFFTNQDKLLRAFVLLVLGACTSWLLVVGSGLLALQAFSEALATDERMPPGAIDAYASALERHETAAWASGPWILAAGLGALALEWARRRPSERIRNTVTGLALALAGVALYTLGRAAWEAGRIWRPF